MYRNSPLPSDEAQRLNTRPSRIAVHNIELRHSNGRSVSPLSPPASTAYDSGDSGGRTEAAPACNPIDRQPQHPGLLGQNQDSPDRNENSSGKKDNLVQRLWLWEVLSIAVAALALAAIVITLVLRRDRPLPKWPSAITINALISIFTAIFKACLMMPIAEGIGQLKWLWYQKSRPLRHMEQWDLASRGPWGSLLLILILKSRDLAVIGAVLTIVAMAVDPFTQQIVQFYSCSTVVESERATVPFSNNYTAGILGGTRGPAILDTQMHLAIYTGLLDPPVNVSEALDFECKTGNCTFPSTEDGATFLSLALGSQCADISSAISISVNVNNYTTDDNVPYSITTTSASLLDYGISIDDTSVYVLRSALHWAPGEPSSFLAKISFLMQGSNNDLQDLQAFECEFYPAVNTYSANVTNGVLLEQVLDSQHMEFWSTRDTGTHSLLLVNRTIRSGKWHECTSSGEPSDEHDLSIENWPNAPYPGQGRRRSYPLDQLSNRDSSGGGASKPTMWWPRDCVYWIADSTTEGLGRSLYDFIGNETAFVDGPKRTKGNLWTLNLWAQGSATLETVQAAMDGLSRSITARLRQGDGTSNNVGPVVGTVWGNQTCVHVNWGWIALPAALLLLTVVFLVLTVISTRSKKAQIWKSSIFAVLFSGLDQGMRQAAGPVVTMEDMNAAADRTMVCLEDTKEGFRLVGQA